MQRDNGCRSPAQNTRRHGCFRPASPSIKINWRKPKPRIHANLHGSAKTLLKSLSSPHRRSAARGALLCDRYPPPGGSRSPAPLIRQNRLCRRIALSNNSNVPGQFVATTRRSFGIAEAREWPALLYSDLMLPKAGNSGTADYVPDKRHTPQSRSARPR